MDDDIIDNEELSQEDENEFDSPDDIKSVEDREVTYTPREYSPDTLFKFYNKGTLITQPDYQRDFIYSIEKQSKLIESILLCLPIPPVYLVKIEGNKMEVIDGQQRIRSIIDFYSNKYKLKDLKVLKELNGCFYKDLPQEYGNLFDQFCLQTIIFNLKSEQFKYDIFSRINQGAVALNKQEIRNCIYRGSLNVLLHKIAKNPLVSEMFIFTNKRMKYEELILRFFAFKEMMPDYKSSIDKISNSFMIKHRNDDEKSIDKLEKQFIDTLKLVKDVLQREAFYGFNRENATIISKFSPTVYDSIMLSFSAFKPMVIRNHKDDIKEKVYEIKKNHEAYKLSCYAATGSRGHVLLRVKTIENALFDCLGDDFEEKRLFDPAVKNLLFHEGYVCSYCNNVIDTKESAEIDHIIPYSLGGKTVSDNAQLLHSWCNKSKNNKV